MRRPQARRVTALLLAASCVLSAAGCAADKADQGSGPRGSGPAADGQPTAGAAASAAVPPTAPLTAHRVVPAPVSVRATPGAAFSLTAGTRILTPPGSPEAAKVAGYLAGLLRGPTGHPLPVAQATGALGAAGAAGPESRIALELAGGAQLGREGYELDATAGTLTLRAHRPEGLFRAVQTVRQLLPAAVERTTRQGGPWLIPAGRITDQPRFAWRGASLDVARHFFSVAEVKRYIDLLVLYKINILHLHLSDDQGWRIAINGWPRLTSHGGSTEVGGGRGGWYSQRDYADIVGYARDRYLTVVPEIDMPGHTNAALASYPELNCDGTERPLFTGIDVGFSALCVSRATTYRFLDDVIGQVAALSGPYFHIGGDEVETLTTPEYARFIERAQQLVRGHGKRVVGWQEVTAARLHPTSVAQYWNTNANPAAVQAAARQGTKLVLSPANKVYLDMKYDRTTKLGMKWAGYVDVRDSYVWDPGTLLPGVNDRHVLGVEAPVWSETLEDIDDVEFMVYPRLASVAEVAWSPAKTRRWEDYRRRLAGHAPRWSAMGADFYRSPQVPWAKTG